MFTNLIEISINVNIMRIIIKWNCVDTIPCVCTSGLALEKAIYGNNAFLCIIRV